MLTNADIDGFYTRVNELGLKFPVAAIAKATGFSKGNISDYLKKRKQPSENFLRKFYQVFPNSSTPELEKPGLKPDDLLVQLMHKQNSLMEMQNRILSEMKDGVQNRVENIDHTVKKVDSKISEMDINLNSVSDTVSSTWAKVSAAIDVSLKSLARLEKKPELSLIGEKDKDVQRMLPGMKKRGNQPGKHK